MHSKHLPMTLTKEYFLYTAFSYYQNSHDKPRQIASGGHVTEAIAGRRLSGGGWRWWGRREGLDIPFSAKYRISLVIRRGSPF